MCGSAARTVTRGNGPAPGVELDVAPTTGRMVLRVDWRVQSYEETEMGKGGRKRRSRRKNSANHGKRPNA